MTEQQAVGLLVAAAVVVFILLAIASRRRRKNSPQAEAQIEPAAIEPTAIAEMVETSPPANWGAGVCFLALMLFSVISLVKYFGAETYDQQLVALLLWIGNSVFWGTLMTVFVLTNRSSHSTIYRKTPPVAAAQRREPNF